MVGGQFGVEVRHGDWDGLYHALKQIKTETHVVRFCLIFPQLFFLFIFSCTPNHF